MGLFDWFMCGYLDAYGSGKVDPNDLAWQAYGNLPGYGQIGNAAQKRRSPGFFAVDFVNNKPHPAGIPGEGLHHNPLTLTLASGHTDTFDVAMPVRLNFRFPDCSRPRSLVPVDVMTITTHLRTASACWPRSEPHLVTAPPGQVPAPPVAGAAGSPSYRSRSGRTSLAASPTTHSADVRLDIADRVCRPTPESCASRKPAG